MPALILGIGFESRSQIYKDGSGVLDQAINVFVAPGTNPNERDADGNNVLHLLCKWKIPYPMLIKTSFIFGVDPTAKNKAGQTPMDVLTSTPRNAKYNSFQEEAAAALQQALDVTEAFTLRARPDSVKGDQFNLLSLDGGGIRGVITARTLQMIERMVGRDVHECFHWYAGTSTGGIIATMLGVLKRSPEYCWQLYLNRKRDMFSGSKLKRVYDIIMGADKNSTQNLEDLIRNELQIAMTSMGQNKSSYTMQDIAAHKGFPKLTIVSLDVTHKPARPTYFRNYEHLEFTDQFIAEETRLATELGVWTPIALTKILRATSAAPTYFLPVSEDNRRFVDGGLTANNPISVLVQECDTLSLHPAGAFRGIRNHVTLALSLGTGGKAAALRAEHSGLYGDIQLFKLFKEQSLGKDGKDHERARARFMSEQVPYLRLSPVGINVGLATVENSDVMTMLWETDAYMLKNKATLQWVADVLCGNVQFKRREQSSTADLEQIIKEKTAENYQLKNELDTLKLELQRRAAALLQQAANDTVNERHVTNLNGEEAAEVLLPKSPEAHATTHCCRCNLL
uniref:PNPLA domain-containing protein n=1 Tax=Plectus sambesii TaxID=2011161 RepID=A0A914WCH8_9BILA